MAGPVPEEPGRKTCLLRQVSRQRSSPCAGVSVWMAGKSMGRSGRKEYYENFCKKLLAKKCPRNFFELYRTCSGKVGHFEAKLG